MGCICVPVAFGMGAVADGLLARLSVPIFGRAAFFFELFLLPSPFEFDRGREVLAVADAPTEAARKDTYCVNS